MRFSMNSAEHIAIVGTSTAQQVADGLSRMILDGELQPGQRIAESVIARELGLSRNTVREAVRLLQGSGLVRYGFNRGLMVWKPSDDDIVDIFAARLQFEAAGAAVLTPKTDLAQVEHALKAYVSVLPDKELRTIVEADLNVHRSLVSLVGSPRLDAYYSQLVDELRYLLVMLLDREVAQDGVMDMEQEHLEIIEAFQTRRPAVARRAIERVNAANCEAVRAMMNQRE